MSKIIVYGLEFDTEQDGNVRRMRNSISLASARAFVEIRKLDLSRSKGAMDVVVNEVIRGRLNTESKQEVADLFDIIKEIVKLGMPYKDIVILRSVYFGFDEIKEFAKRGRTAASVLKEYEIENPEIETVYGLTSDTLREWYISYDRVKELAI